MSLPSTKPLTDTGILALEGITDVFALNLKRVEQENRALKEANQRLQE